MCLSYLMFSWALRKHTFTDYFVERIIQKMEMLIFYTILTTWLVEKVLLLITIPHSISW